MRRGRRFRWLVVILLVTIGLYFVLDVTIRQYIASRGADQIAKVLSAQDATVKLPGIPFLPGFVRGHIGEMEINVIGASGAGGLRVQSIQARLSDLHFSARKLFALAGSSFATRTTVTAEQPVALVELGERDLQTYLQDMVPEVGKVQVKATGVEVYFYKDLSKPPPNNPRDEELTKPARFLPVVDEDSKITLRLVGFAEVPPELRSTASRIENIINLPAIPRGLRTDVRLGKGVIVFESTGHQVSLEVGEGEK